MLDRKRGGLSEKMLLPLLSAGERVMGSLKEESGLKEAIRALKILLS